MNLKRTNVPSHLDKYFDWIAAFAFLFLGAYALKDMFFYIKVDPDSFLAITNPVSRDWSLLSRFFSQQYFLMAGTSYEPVVTFVYFFLFSVSPPDPIIFRTFNVLLLSLNAFLAYRISLELVHERSWAFAAGILYLTHPIHATNWTVITPHSLMTIFSLLGFYFHLSCIKHGITRKRIAAVSICYILALLSKESGFMLPFLFLIFDFIYPFDKSGLQTRGMRRNQEYFWLLTIAFSYILALQWVLIRDWDRPFSMSSIWIQSSGVWYPRLMTAAEVLYGGKIGFHSYLLIGIFGLGIWKLSYRQTAFFILAIVLPLLPALNIVHFGHYSDYLARNSMGGRYLLLSAIFSQCFIVLSLRQCFGSSHAKLIAYGLAGYLVLCNGMLFQSQVENPDAQFRYMKNYFAAWSNEPENGKSCMDLLDWGQTLPFVRKYFPDNFKEIERIIQTNLPFPTARTILLYFAESDLYGDPIQSTFHKGLVRRCFNQSFRKNLVVDEIQAYNAFATQFKQARVYAAQMDFQKGMQPLNRAIEIRPDSGEAVFLRAHLHFQNRNLRDAMMDYKRASHLSPEKLQLTDVPGLEASRQFFHDREIQSARWCDHGVALFRKGKIEESLAQFEQALRYDPSNYYALLSRAAVMNMHADEREELRDINTVIALKPDDSLVYADALSSRANIHIRKGRKKEAIADIENALKIAPKEWPHRKSLYAQLKKIKSNRP